MEREEANEKAASPDLGEQPSHSDGLVHEVWLEGLTLQSEGTRQMTYLQTISASWIICDSWAGVAATLALAIAQGGPATLTYGLIFAFIMVGACTLTLAELASVYPTAGGQYHWTSILAPKNINRALSYCCGVANVFSWIAICSGIAIIPAQLIMGMVQFFNEDYVGDRWQGFLIYHAVNGIVLLYNVILLKRSFWFHDFCFFFMLSAFVVILITCLARTSPDYEPAKNVWATFLNASGWDSRGIAFLTGLVSPNYMYAGIDGALHLAEECKNAAEVVPRALMSTLLIGFTTSFAFMIAMLYCTTDLNAVVETATGVPIYEMWYQATRSEAAATTFLVILACGAFFALTGAQQASSRLTWSLARDEALLGSRWIGRMHPTLEVPVWALLFNFAVMFIIGCIYLGSSTAFNAFIGTGLVLQHISYAFPAALLIYRNRSSTFLPKSRGFRLPGPVGWAANVLTVVFAVLVLIFYDFPTVIPVTPSNMNYTSAVLGVMAIFAGVNWAVYAKKEYHGPRLRGADDKRQTSS